MTEGELVARFGLPPREEDRREIIRLLADETERCRRHEGNEEALRLLCVLLFALGRAEDALPIWRAKSANFDAHCGIPVQLLCAAGLEAAKAYLAGVSAPEADSALGYLRKCEGLGNLAGFSPERELRNWIEYYRDG